MPIDADTVRLLEANTSAVEALKRSAELVKARIHQHEHPAQDSSALMARAG